MIDKDKFLKFLSNTFDSSQLFVEKFKPELWFVEIDCFPNESYKITIEISNEDIRISTIHKIPSLDFSLYEYIYKENNDAEKFIIKSFQQQKFK